MSHFALKPIGVIHSQVKQRRNMPPVGVRATIEVFADFAQGLRQLEKHSHLWVLAWLHRATRQTLLVTPRGVEDMGSEGLHGVFAVRSPTRPNPVGLSVTKIDSIDRNRIRVKRLDFIDGTPVIDLKPYFRRFEAIPMARNDPIGRPASRDALLRALLVEAENFHGERCPGMALAARIVEHAKSTLFNHSQPLGLRLIAPRLRGCLIDSMIGLLSVSFGRGTLQLADGESLILSDGQRRYCYRLTAGDSQAFEGIIAAAETELFRFSVE